jgi:PGF-CTERM protein
MFVLVAVMPASAVVYKVNTSINQGATVFIGEQGLNLQPASNYFNGKAGYVPAQIGWWASAAQIGTTSPTATVPLASTLTNFIVSPAAFGSYYGPWYVINPATGFGDTTGGAFINVKDPSLTIDVWDWTQGASVSGKSIPQGDMLGFKVGTNMDVAVNQPTLRYQQVGNGEVAYWADIKVKTEAGNTFLALYDTTNGGTTKAINRQNVNLPSWPWGTIVSGWATDALDQNGQIAYPAGSYTVSVESYLNAMYDNYQNGGAAYTGKTVSEAKVVTLVSDTVKITANKDSVVRSKVFSITITGKPSTYYKLWVKGSSTMSGGYDDQPPMINQNQAGVYFQTVMYGVRPTPNLGLLPTDGVLGYQYQNGAGAIVWDDVAKGSGTTVAIAMANGAKLGNGSYVSANVLTSSSGTRTVEFVTTNWTKAQKYTLHVELNAPSGFKTDEVDVKIEKGAVTIVAAGDQSYYLGEEIKFSGTNTETQTTYLFITGPNLETHGSQIQSADPRNNPVVSGNPSSFQSASVSGDNTWSWKWGTSNIALDAGTYTIWAVSQPSDSSPTNLAQCAYGTVSIIVKKPFISATASQSTVAMGDRVFITGTAEGKPSSGVQIWILGKNYAVVQSESVNSDSSFSYEITRETTQDLAAGQYFVVAQHPMQNNRFDIYEQGGQVYNRMLGILPGTKVFNLLGAGSLQGSDAAEALVQAINDPNVDDTYTKLQFLIENPIITITPVGDRHVGDKFTILATTNLAVDDEILCQVYSSSFKPTQKSQSGEFSGATGTVKVTKGDSGLNKISFDVDASTFKPDEYIVQFGAVIQSATGSALFNVLEGAAPTAVPTVAPTAVPTTVATTVPTTVATPTKTPTQPGFGALVALIGLGAVALLVVRRH